MSRIVPVVASCEVLPGEEETEETLSIETNRTHNTTFANFMAQTVCDTILGSAAFLVALGVSFALSPRRDFFSGSWRS